MGGLQLDIANGWRIYAKNLLKENFNVINPCDFYNYTMNSSEYTEEEIKEFDLWNVKKSNIVLVSLDFPDSIGTAIEVHMAHDEWKIPVIAFGGNKKRIHPWIILSLTKRCDTVENAVKYINEFYLPNM